MQTIYLIDKYYSIFEYLFFGSLLFLIASIIIIIYDYYYIMGVIMIGFILCFICFIGFANSYTEDNYKLIREKITTEIIKTQTYKTLILNPMTGEYEVFEGLSSTKIDSVYLNKYYSRSNKFLSSEITLITLIDK